MTFVLATLIGLLCGAIGAFVAFTASQALAGGAGSHDTQMGRSVLSLSLAGLAAAVSFGTGLVMALRSRGITQPRAIIANGLGAIAAVVLLVFSGAAYCYYAQDRPVNPAGWAPDLIVEVLPPPNVRLPLEQQGMRIQVLTDSRVRDGRFEAGAVGVDGRETLTAEVPLQTRSPRRLLVLTLPDRSQRVYNLSLPADPRSARHRQWSAWRRADFRRQLDAAHAQPISAGPDYQIRYRVQPNE